LRDRAATLRTQASGWSELFVVGGSCRGVPNLLCGLGRVDDASMVLGAYEASGIARAQLRLPRVVSQLAVGDGDTHLEDLHALGGKLKLAELIRGI
jgi:hypothetical protein